ncbi:hypothetical protein [Mesoterricola sediminis]|uniref:DUF2271 domain-containing protein n=1 Tax=Mesoterricola sediminis TaxID=2927980 RepID=A0AA48GWQ7_9BACT|nr:hypothetical protein [Mesoterricola sediminis]BDU77065.1 hypothetical protein METESE_20230 [Mesoterricola sediminis]
MRRLLPGLRPAFALLAGSAALMAGTHVVRFEAPQNKTFGASFYQCKDGSTVSFYDAYTWSARKNPASAPKARLNPTWRVDATGAHDTYSTKSTASLKNQDVWYGEITGFVVSYKVQLQLRGGSGTAVVEISGSRSSDYPSVKLVSGTGVKVISDGKAMPLIKLL